MRNKMRISRKMNFKEITSIQGSSSSAHGRAQAPLLPRKQDLSVEHLLAPAVVSIPGAGSRQTLQNKKCREWGTWRRFFSPKCCPLAICYVLPIPLFLRLTEQMQPLIKTQNYKACLVERKQYLSHSWFWEGYNSPKSWAKLSSVTLINCAQKDRIETNIFQKMLELKVCCRPTASSFHYKKTGFLLTTIKKKILGWEFSKRIWFSQFIFRQPQATCMSHLII